MAPHAQLAFLFGENNRKVKMQGKIFFKVKHDNNRPFRIDGDNSVVEILGTRFQMTDIGGEASLYVVSGKVRYSAQNCNNNVILTRGMSATIRKGTSVPTVIMHGDVNETSWATGKFIFHATPIRDVLHTLGEYYHIDFVASNDTKLLTGEFSTDDVAGTISMIESVLNIKISKGRQQ